MLFSVRHRLLYRILFVLSACFLSHSFLGAQKNLAVDAGFSSAWISPDWLQDTKGEISIDQITERTYAGRFHPGNNPYLTFGTDQSPYWLHFIIRNEDSVSRTLMLRLNRKNIARFELWQKNQDSGEPVDLGKVGADRHNDIRYELTDGFHFPVVLQTGDNEFWANTANHIGSMYLNLSLHTPDDFSMVNRRNIILLGIFLGVMLLSFVFSLVLFIQYRDMMYLLYGIYILNILVRELYNYSADFGLLSHLGHQCISSLIAATFGMFLRRFLRLWEVAPRWDKLVRVYIGGIFLCVGLIWLFESTGQKTLLQYLFAAVNGFFILFTLNALYLSMRDYRKSERARLALLAFTPLSMAFIAILLRNLAWIPSYPLIQHAVLVGFVLEVLVFTIGFSRWHRSVELDRNLLQLNLEMEQQKKQLDIKEAEQQVKDQIARDLHDDVAASMSSIRILSQVAFAHLSKTAPDTAPLLEQINRNAQATLESISDLIWAVKPNPDYLNDMADRMREYAGKVLDAKDIDYQLNIPRNLPMRNVDIATRRNVYLIFKEAVNNAVKYSNCRRMDISLQITGETLTLSVADDGAGFDPATTSKGNGLGNMEKRARDIRGVYRICAEPGNGTEVFLSVPLENV